MKTKSHFYFLWSLNFWGNTKGVEILLKKGKHEHSHGLGPKRVIEINGIGVGKRRSVWIRKLDF